MIGPDDPDHYYKQPGHALSPKVQTGRFKHTKEYEKEWTP